MSRKIAVLLCPGRGSYGRDELGFLQRTLQQGPVAEALAASDDWRRQQGRSTTAELDAAATFRPGVHLDGENAAELIYFGTLADSEHLRDRFRIVARSPQLIAKYKIASKRVLLSVGRLVPRKGIDRTLEAMPKLLQRHPDLHYLIVGDGPYRERLQQMVAELGLASYVTFTGPIGDEELRAHYALCDLFVLPNREMPDGDTEGFGLVFLEANACGKPVVGGRAGGVVEAVQDGHNGLLVNGDNVDSIVEAVCKLLEDEALYQRLRRGGMEIAERSGWQLRTQQFQALCARLV